MSEPQVTVRKVIEVRFTRGDGVKTRRRVVRRYYEIETSDLIVEVDPCAGDDGLDRVEVT